MSNKCLLPAELNSPEMNIQNYVTLAFTHKSLSHVNTEKFKKMCRPDYTLNTHI